MSVQVKHLNADSTFLLTFSLPTATGEPSGNGVFTVLIDPWLAESGAPQIHAKFAYAARKVPSHVSHLSQIPAPDVVVISQAKPDHCHEDTLRQLPPDLPKTTILAHPDAARKIRSWRYFEPSKVHSLRSFAVKDEASLVRFSIPAGISGGASPGEATLTLVTQQRDVTKLHNAIAITYRPPIGSIATSPNTQMIYERGRVDSGSSHAGDNSLIGMQLKSMLSNAALERHQAQLQIGMQPAPPLTPPDTPPEMLSDTDEAAFGRPSSNVTNFSLPFSSQRQRVRNPASLEKSPRSDDSCFSPVSPQLRPSISSIALSSVPSRASDQSISQDQDVAKSRSSSGQQSEMGSLNGRTRSTSSTSTSHLPKTVSVLYAPHGIEFGAIKPYATSQLVRSAALPLTLLLHPFDRIDNPWWLGGNITSGVPGALEIVRKLMVRNWVNAHDEEKDESGLGLKMIKKGKWTSRQVSGLLGKGMCEVSQLECGQQTSIIA